MLGGVTCIPMVSEITPLLIISKLEQYDVKGATAIAFIILNPKFRSVAGERVLDLDFDKVAAEVFPLVISKKGRLTGGEIKFIRHYLSMNQSAFAEAMGLSDHSTVSRWEKAANKITRMDLHTESIIRMKAWALAGQRLTKTLFAASFDDLKENLSDPGEVIKLDVA